MPPITEHGSLDGLHGTWFTLTPPSVGTPRQSIETIEAELERFRPAYYWRLHNEHKPKLVVNISIIKSLNGAVSRGRVLLAHPAIVGDRLLISVRLQNAFWRTDATRTVLVSDPELENFVGDRKWIKRVSDIPLLEHIQAFQMLTQDLSAIGYPVGQVEERNAGITLPKVRTGSGELDYSPGVIPNLISKKWFEIPSTVEVGIASKSVALVSKVGANLQAAASKITNGQCRIITKSLRQADPEMLNLFMIPKDLDLSGSPAWRKRLVEHESNGLRFNLVNEGNFENARPYAYQNLCLDLLIQAGAKPWQPVDIPGLSIGLDAGHSRVENRSRWTATQMRKDNPLEPKILIEETLRAEHIPADTLMRWWPSFAGSDVLVMRDGKVANEFEQIKRYSLADGQAVAEIPKRPCIVLYRGTLDNPKPALYGDALVHPRAGVLLQSNSVKESEYGPPIWVRSVHGKSSISDVAQSVLNLTAVPGQLYNPPRLPAPLYWADAVSKLTSKDWTSVIGRGLGIQSIIPK